MPASSRGGGWVNRPTVICKTAADLRLPPNLIDYAATRAVFSWEAVRAELRISR